MMLTSEPYIVVASGLREKRAGSRDQTSLFAGFDPAKREVSRHQIQFSSTAAPVCTNQPAADWVILLMTVGPNT